MRRFAEASKNQDRVEVLRSCVVLFAAESSVVLAEMGQSTQGWCAARVRGRKERLR